MALSVRTEALGGILGGALTAAIGVAFLLGGLGLRFAGARGIGPGYFPVVLSIILIILGAWVALGAVLTTRDDAEGMESIEWRPFLAVFGAIAAFGVTVYAAGLLPAVFVLVLVAALASGPISRTSLLIAVGMTLFTWLVFIVALRLPVDPYKVPFL